MSIYVLQSGKAVLECDMEYGEGREITCIVSGVSRECVEEAVKRTEYGGYMMPKGSRLYISTSIFRSGKTPGELIKELATLLRLC